MIALSLKVIAIFVLIACGMPESPRVINRTNQQIVDSRLLPHIEAFLVDCKKYRKDCDQRVSHIQSILIVEKLVDENTIGLCTVDFPNTRIQIREDQLAASRRYLRAIIYHELAHCAYFTQHVERKNTLISTYIPGLHVLIGEWDNLVVDLFQEIGAQYEN